MITKENGSQHNYVVAWEELYVPPYIVLLYTSQPEVKLKGHIKNKMLINSMRWIKCYLKLLNYVEAILLKYTARLIDSYYIHFNGHYLLIHRSHTTKSP